MINIYYISLYKCLYKNKWYYLLLLLLLVLLLLYTYIMDVPFPKNEVNTASNKHQLLVHKFTKVIPKLRGRP